MQFLFALTLFVSASLLFLVEPMFAKMAVPLLGGTAAVWNTCLVFYQAVLLLGYVYAHFSTRWLGTRRQAAVHLGVLLLPWLVLPIGIASGQLPTGESNPVPYLLLLLTVSVGLPLFTISASAPMLQAWFADAGHRSSKDPYYLYAASNLGSMLGLLSYPFLVDRYLPVTQQTWAWTAGYGVLMALTLGCAVLLWRSRAARAVGGGTAAKEDIKEETPQDAAFPTMPQRLRWLALSFAPSSLLLGVTTFISVDLASVPLLWIIPLALYLLTFVLAFGRWPSILHRLMVWIQPVPVLVAAVIFQESLHEWMWAVILLHLGMFFLTALVCHGDLARSRPAARHLTEFYIWISVGGVLGGLFNALVAPVIFPTVIEYPLVIALACMLRPLPAADKHPVRSRWLDLVVPLWLWFVLKELTNWLAHGSAAWLPVSGWAVAIVLATGLVALAFRSWLARGAIAGWVLLLATFLGWQCWVWHARPPAPDPEDAAAVAAAEAKTEAQLHSEHAAEVFGQLGTKDWLGQLRTYLKKHEWKELAGQVTAETLILSFGALAALAMVFRPIRFGMAVGVVLLAGHVWYGSDSTTSGSHERVLHVARSFFGVIRVKEDTDDKTHTLVHGSTTHGMQSTEEGKRLEPWTYYHHGGPLGDVMDNLLDPTKPTEIGVIGLGTGSTAAYARQFQDVTVTYFEIDRAVKEIAENPALFTYVTDARAPRPKPAKSAEVDIVMGDARLSLDKQPDGRFDVLIVDAFSSDAIPIHLLTREAVELYMRKLKPRTDGQPGGILMVHVSNRYLDLSPVVGNIAADLGLVARVRNDEERDRAEGKFGSEWVAVVADEKRFGDLQTDVDWEEIPPNDRVGLWTDDFSNIIPTLVWYREAQAWLRRHWSGPAAPAKPPE